MYASPGARGVALILDLFIVGFLVLAAKLAVELAGAELGGAGEIALVVAYFAGFPLTKWQATPGKRVGRIKVTDLAGGKIGAGRALLRFAASLLSIGSFGLGYVVSSWNGRHQALHDLIARTAVVDAKALPGQFVASAPATPSWKSRIAGTVVWIFVLGTPVYVYLYPLHGQLASEINDRNMQEALPVVAGLESYRKKNGRYPESLAVLVPQHLARAPSLYEGTALPYAASSGGDECWLAIVYWRGAGLLPSDRGNEYECRSGTWATREYEELRALRSGANGGNR